MLERYMRQAFSNSNLLAVFWYIDGKFYGEEETLEGENVIVYADRFVQIDADHYNLWGDIQRMNPDLAGDEYDAYPRGRVIFDAALHKFKVICDEKLCTPENQRVVRNYYGLPETTIFDSDEHYTSYKD